MHKLIVAALVVASAAFDAAAAQESSPASPVINLGHVNCVAPRGWEATTDESLIERAKIHEIQFLAPRSEGAPVMISAPFYADGDTDFKNYPNFIERNSQDAIGRTESPTRRYSPVSEVLLNGRKAYCDPQLKISAT